MYAEMIDGAALARLARLREVFVGHAAEAGV